MISARQIRAARALLLLGQRELAARAEIGIATLRRIEAAVDEITGTAQTMSRIQRALEAAGIVFIDQDGKSGPGVKLRDPLP
jgi:transcriptional regulator with XRE-family HTH domain